MARDQAFHVTRDNLPEAIEYALRTARNCLEAATDFRLDQDLRLAIRTLEDIRHQMADETPPVGKRTTCGFGAAMVHDEPTKIDPGLVEVVMRIEDVYRRWWKPRKK